MKWDELEEEPCSLARTVGVIGDRWTLLILRELSLGPQRFTDLRQSLPGIAPNLLAERLQANRATRHLAVQNHGISGNRTLFNFIGPNAQARLDRDVLNAPGAKFVILLEGINNIGLPGAFGIAGEAVSADDIIAGHKQIIARARERGLKIFGGTLTPFEGTTFPGYFTPEGEAKRQAVNHWIRTSGAFDGVIDFDRAVRDPAHPARMLPAYDSGDHLHPGDAGYKAMADSIDLRLFRGGGNDD